MNLSLRSKLRLPPLIFVGLLLIATLGAWMQAPWLAFSTLVVGLILSVLQSRQSNALLATLVQLRDISNDVGHGFFDRRLP